MGGVAGSAELWRRCDHNRGGTPWQLMDDAARRAAVKVISKAVNGWADLVDLLRRTGSTIQLVSPKIHDLAHLPYMLSFFGNSDATTTGTADRRHCRAALLRAAVPHGCGHDGCLLLRHGVSCLSALSRS
jgi:hypothetical protein